MKRLPFAGLALTSALVISGCAGADAGEEPAEEISGTVTVFGSITVPPREAVDVDGSRLSSDAESIPGGGECKTWKGFADISEGGQITVTNAANEIVAIGKLGAGVQQSRSWTYREWFRMKTPICEFSFSFEAPAGESFYTIALGNANRGEFTVTEAELGEGIFLTLGG